MYLRKENRRSVKIVNFCQSAELKKILGFLSKRVFHLFQDKLNKNTYTFPYRYQEKNYFMV
ncbi:hypothetical protein UA45_07190 [Morganella morganii]|uniref:Uncharacterized protein n=1 Tax=Morganella morganii TaxID=582 RepID=A0A0D8LAZ3_MORMO|nr:hypothetical protein UA45_07190 [Morganella morganii]